MSSENVELLATVLASYQNGGNVLQTVSSATAVAASKEDETKQNIANASIAAAQLLDGMVSSIGKSLPYLVIEASEKKLPLAGVAISTLSALNNAQQVIRAIPTGEIPAAAALGAIGDAAGAIGGAALLAATIAGGSVAFAATAGAALTVASIGLAIASVAAGQSTYSIPTLKKAIDGLENLRSTLGDTFDSAYKSLKDAITGAAADAAAAGDAIGKALGAIGDWLSPGALGLGKGPKAISPVLGTTPDPIVDGIIYRVMMWADPLVLDLDGDGYEITAISPGVHFDSDGDGLKNKMAWVGADDGLLVLDRNGNGLIDSGRELFGDDTILENGKTAVHGFAALSELDTSHDGKFDIADEKFLDVRVWKDVNQDGISQETELSTLSAVGVKSISLSNQPSSENHGDAILNYEGTYERTNGTQGGVGCFIFAQDRFDRVFSPIEISTNAATVLDIKGTGYVRPESVFPQVHTFPSSLAAYILSKPAHYLTS